MMQVVFSKTLDEVMIRSTGNDTWSGTWQASGLFATADGGAEGDEMLSCDRLSSSARIWSDTAVVPYGLRNHLIMACLVQGSL